MNPVPPYVFERALQRCKVGKISRLYTCILFITLQGHAQTNSSPIWGAGNSSQPSIGAPLYDARTWGMTPSQQTLNSIPNRNGIGNVVNNHPRRYRNSAGNLLLTDAQGDIVYNAQGIPVIDSVGNGYVSGSVNTDASGGGSPPPPPDDPMDVPIDGGVGILLMIGLGVGYKNRKMLNKTANPKAALTISSF